MADDFGHAFLKATDLHRARALSDASRPDSRLTPTIVGEFFQETVGPEVWIANGLTDTSWYQLSASPPGYLDGCRLTWVSATQVTIGTAAVVSTAHSSQAYDIKWTGALTADIAVSGAGGLDTGSEAASTGYFVHVIGDITGTNGPAALLSLSATAPTLPSGYTSFRRLGWAYNDSGSNLRPFEQLGSGRDRVVFWSDSFANLTALSGGTAITFTTVSFSAFMPTTSQHAWLNYAFDQSGATGFAELREGGSTVLAPPTFLRVGLNTASSQASCIQMRTDATQNVEYLVTTGSNLDLIVRGYVDSL